MSPSTPPFLEIAAFTLPSALHAIASGASRIEYCTSRSTGGLTPSSFPSSIHLLRQIATPSSTSTPIKIMIRSNPSLTFTITPSDLISMATSIQEFKPVASGFVFGVLNTDGSIDEETCRKLVDEAGGLPCTFHRAFDYVTRPETVEARLGALKRCGFVSVLTSGGRGEAAEGVEVLKRTVREGERLGIEVVVGGGVRMGNVRELMRKTGARMVHTAAIRGEGEEVDGEEVRGILGEMERALEEREEP